MFQFYDISNEQRHELHVWADIVIESNKEAMSSGKAYWLWSDRLYYQPGKDTWTDESWWIEIAKKSFIKHKDNEYNGVGYPVEVVPSLEILVHHFPEEYRDYAKNKLARWYEEQGYNDPEYWFDLIVSVYPDHPATELLFEQQENPRESSIAIKLGYLKAAMDIKENILEELKNNDVYFMCHFLDALDQNTFSELFSEAESNEIELAMLSIAQKELPSDDRSWSAEKYTQYTQQHSILSTAITLQWQRILNILANNTSYLEKLLCAFKQSSSEEILLWSLTDKYELTENLVLQLYAEKSVLNKIHHMSFPSHEFVLAIAWKRSQSKA
jgi:hypothetical protein